MSPAAFGAQACHEGPSAAEAVAAGRLDEGEVVPMARGILAANSQRVYRLPAE